MKRKEVRKRIRGIISRADSDIDPNGAFVKVGRAEYSFANIGMLEHELLEETDEIVIPIDAADISKGFRVVFKFRLTEHGERMHSRCEFNAKIRMWWKDTWNRQLKSFLIFSLFKWPLIGAIIVYLEKYRDYAFTKFIEWIVEIFS